MASGRPGYSRAWVLLLNLGFCFVLPLQAVPSSMNAVSEDIYSNGSAMLGSPAHTNGREIRKMRFIQFEKVAEEPMVSW